MKQRGFTLLEILLVVIILGVATLVAIPSFTSYDSKRLDNAAAEVAQALRYARSAALQRGEPIGVVISPGTHRVQVYRLDITSNPVLIYYDVRHPHTRQLYHLDLRKDSTTRGATVSAVQFRYQGDPGAYASVTFNPQGLPVFYTNATSTRPLTLGTVQVSGGDRAITIDLDPATQRVSLP